jgi:hypothetical protein
LVRLGFSCQEACKVFGSPAYHAQGRVSKLFRRAVKRTVSDPLSTNTEQFPGLYGSLTVTGSTFRGNVADGNSSFGCCAGGSSAGGAIWADPQVGVTIGSSQFVDNEAELANLSGIASGIVSGGAIDLNPGTFAFPTPPPSVATITNSVFTGNVAIGTGVVGSQADGGAINAGGFGDPGG